MYKVTDYTLETEDEILKCNKLNERYRAVLSFGTLYIAVVLFIAL